MLPTSSSKAVALRQGTMWSCSKVRCDLADALFQHSSRADDAPGGFVSAIAEFLAGLAS